MEPEDGGYATTDEELDSDDGKGGVELDLKMWLSQLDSPAPPAASTVPKVRQLTAGETAYGQILPHEGRLCHSQGPVQGV